MIAGTARTTLVLFAMSVACSIAPAQFAAASDNADGAQTTTTSITYRDSTDPAIAEKCIINLHRPAGVRSDGFATVVWFHAGGLRAGTPSIPAGLMNKDIAVASAGYRLSPDVEARVCIEDAAAAVAWVIGNIESLGGDPSRVFVAGHSAGGYLASMIALDDRWLGAHDIDPNDLAGVISVSGHSVTHFTVRAERGVPGTRAIVDDMAPLFHVRADAPPMLLVSGDREKEMLGRYEESAFFWRMMRVAGHERTELLELDGYDHGGVAAPAMPLLLDFVDSVLDEWDGRLSPD